jgi:hypothetical protein
MTEPARHASSTATDLLRGVLRSAVAAALLVPVARSAFPVSSVIYVALLLLPLSVVEGALERRDRRIPLVVAAGVAWLAPFALVVLAHFQAVYAVGVADSHSLDGGLAAIRAECARLDSILDPDLVPLRKLHADFLVAAAVAVVFNGFTLAPDHDYEKPLALAVTLGGGFVSATVVATGFIALADSDIVVFAPLIAMMIGVYAFVVLVAVIIARFVADFVMQWND